MGVQTDIIATSPMEEMGGVLNALHHVVASKTNQDLVTLLMTESVKKKSWQNPQTRCWVS